MRISANKKQHRIICFIASFLFWILIINNFGCNAKERFQSEKESTEKVIGKSEALTNLDKVCRDIPLFERIEPLSKRLGKDGDILFYQYDLRFDFIQVKHLAKIYLESKGWILNKEKDSFMEDKIEFEKENYWLQIANGYAGDYDYAVSCKDFTIPKK